MSDNRTTDDRLTDRVTHPRYPLSSQYDARWTVDNQMGPNALWLLEWLAPALGLDALRPCARVLDLGCGRAMTSVFLAREFHAQVTAADLWVAPDDNARRVTEAGKPRDFFVRKYGRLRTVTAAPDGTLWVTTSNTDGRGSPHRGDDKILRIALR